MGLGDYLQQQRTEYIRIDGKAFIRCYSTAKAGQAGVRPRWIQDDTNARWAVSIAVQME